MQVMALSWEKKTPESTESNLIVVDDKGNSLGLKLVGDEGVIQVVMDKLSELKTPKQHVN